MSRKDKDRQSNRKPNQGQGGPGKKPQGAPPNVNAERNFNNQLNKVEGLFEQENFEDGLDLLLQLDRKYPKRAEVQDLLGVAYVALESYGQARDAFEHALEWGPKGGEAEALLRFNLAHMYLLTGFPLLAYQQCQRVNWDLLAEEVEGDDEIAEFRQIAEESVTELAEQNKQPLAEFVQQSLPIEQGQLALQRSDPGTARQKFEEAIRLNPRSVAAYNSLAMTSFIQNNDSDAIKQSEHVLAELDPQNLDALSTLVRIYQRQHNLEAAQRYLTQIKTLPVPEEVEDRVQLADVYALFEDDQAVYDLIRPLFENEEIWEEIEPEAYEEALLLLLVSAIHLQKRDEAIELIENMLEVGDNLLLDRTMQAIEADEEGPRLNGRFFYAAPPFIYTGAFQKYTDLLREAVSTPETEEDDFRIALNPFYKEYGPIALDITAFQAWMTEDQPMAVATMLTQVVASGVENGVELVKHFAFGRVGTDADHLVAAAVLAEEGLIKPTDELTLWIEGEPRTATLEEFTQMLSAEVEE